MLNNLKLHEILKYLLFGVFFMYVIGGVILRALIEAEFGVIMVLHFHVPIALFLTVEAILLFATAFTKYLYEQKQTPVVYNQQKGPADDLHSYMNSADPADIETNNYEQKNSRHISSMEINPE